MLIAAAMTLALAADPMQNIVGNVAEVTYPDGSVINWMFADDNTFTTDAGLSGTWRLDGANLCLTITVEGATGEESCNDLGEKTRHVGDTWTMTGGDGAEFTVTIKDGGE